MVNPQEMFSIVFLKRHNHKIHKNSPSLPTVLSEKLYFHRSTKTSFLIMSFLTIKNYKEDISTVYLGFVFVDVTDNFLSLYLRGVNFKCLELTW